MFWKKPFFWGFLAAAAIACFLGWNLATLGVGLPSAGKLALLSASPKEHKTLVPYLNRLRQKIYAQIADSERYSVNKGFAIPPEERPFHYYRAFLLQPLWFDEMQMVRAFGNINPKALRFDPHFYRFGSTGIYLMGGSIRLGQALGFYPNPSDIEALLVNPDYSRRIWLAPRLLSLLFLILAVAAMFAAAKTAWGKNWGWLAATLLAGSPLALMNCHYLKPYALSLLPAALVYYFLVKNKTLAAAVCAGIAMSMLPTNGILIVPVVLAAWLGTGKKPWRTALVCASVSLGIFLLLNPWYVYSLKNVLAEARTLMALSNPAGPDCAYLSSGCWNNNANLPASASCFYPLNWLKLWFIWLPAQLGCYLLVFLALGAAAWIFKRDRLASLGLATLAAATPLLTKLNVAHYATPFLPAIIFTEVYGIFALSRKFPRLSKILAAACVGFTLSHSAFYMLSLEKFEKMQFSAGEWINSNIPEGSSIGFLREVQPGGLYPPFWLLNYKLEVLCPDARPDGSELKKLLAEKPEYYCASGINDIDLSPEFGSAYEKISGLSVKTAFDRLWRNYIYPPISSPVRIYKLRPSERRAQARESR